MLLSCRLIPTMSAKIGAAELQSMDIEALRRQNIADNQRILKEIMGDLQALMPPKSQSRPKKVRAKRAREPDEDEPVRRNPSRAARLSLLQMSPPRTRSRSSSFSSTSSRLSSPNKMVVKFGFCERGEAGESQASGSDLEEEYVAPKRLCVARDERSAEDITEDDLKMVAVTVKDKFYDAIYGTSCHQCRQKTNDMKTICRSGFCYGVRGQFCGPCLRNRYGEDAKEALKNPEWQCPPCRKICNCSFCRKKQGKSCTGILIHLARESGYSNVNDYLQSLKNRFADAC